MRKILIVLSFIISSQVLVAQSNVVPALQLWKPTGNELVLPDNFTLRVEGEGAQSLQKLADLFILDVQEVSGLSAKLVDKASAHVTFLMDKDLESLGSEGYSLEINDKVLVKASTPTGLFYGAQTLLQALKQTGNTLEKGSGEDYPNFATRAIMIDVGRRFYQMEYLEEVLRNMAWHKLNVLHLHFTEWSGFRLKSDKFPGLSAEEAYSKADIRRLQDVAKQYHIMIVPEIDLPAHATAITDFMPELAFSCESMRKARWQGPEADSAGRAWTLDVTRPEVRAFIKELLDEFIPLFDGPYFHVGGDEYQYDPEKYQCPELLEYMEKHGYEKPGDVFIEWLNEVNEQVKSYGKQTQIWNWWRFWKNETSIQPNKDIIVNVWNKPRQEEIVAEGYKVIITPESELYVSPGLINEEGYGVVDCKERYEQWMPEQKDNILGYKICIWADRAEHHTDYWFEGHAYEPKAVLAEKLWGKNGSTTYGEFLSRLNRIGKAPKVGK